MKNNKRVRALENKINISPTKRCVFILPFEITNDRYICKKIVDKTNGNTLTNGLSEPIRAIALLPDNHRAPPDQELNKIIKEVLIEEKREDLLEYIRWK